MGERSPAWFAPSYELKTVRRLMGLDEGRGHEGARHITIVDLLSWLQDPGGEAVWYRLALFERSSDEPTWFARRGPLAPDSEVACVAWDFLRAVAELNLKDQAVVALRAFGFSQRDIAGLLHISQTEVSRILRGDQTREGAVFRVHRRMNGSDDG